MIDKTLLDNNVKLAVDQFLYNYYTSLRSYVIQVNVSDSLQRTHLLIHDMYDVDSLMKESAHNAMGFMFNSSILHYHEYTGCRNNNIRDLSLLYHFTIHNTYLKNRCEVLSNVWFEYFIHENTIHRDHYFDFKFIRYLTLG